MNGGRHTGFYLFVLSLRRLGTKPYLPRDNTIRNIHIIHITGFMPTIKRGQGYFIHWPISSARISLCSYALQPACLLSPQSSLHQDSSLSVITLSGFTSICHDFV